jgi:hypothetical protein
MGDGRSGERAALWDYTCRVPSTFRVTLALAALCALGHAQSYGTTPRPKATDYPVQARAGDLVIAAEYLLHSVGTGTGAFVAPDYLVVEIAVYPAKRQPVTISSGQFTLRVNGKKEELPSQPPGFVAASLKYADWENPRGFEPMVRAGPVTVGGPQQQAPRFPGDRRAETGPQPPRAPTNTPGGVERPVPQTAPEAVVETAFPDGECTGPVSGNLYFNYTKKPKSIKTLDLIWRHGQEQTEIKLF